MSRRSPPPSTRHSLCDDGIEVDDTEMSIHEKRMVLERLVIRGEGAAEVPSSVCEMVFRGRPELQLRPANSPDTAGLLSAQIGHSVQIKRMSATEEFQKDSVCNNRVVGSDPFKSNAIHGM